MDGLRFKKWEGLVDLVLLGRHCVCGIDVTCTPGKRMCMSYEHMHGKSKQAKDERKAFQLLKETVLYIENVPF